MAARRAARTVLMIGLALGAGGSIAALAAQDTLKSAAQKAVLGSPEVLNKWHAYRAAESEKDVAAGGYLPRVDLSAGVGREHRDDPLLRKDYSRRSATLSLTQMLYDGFATRNEVRRLDHARQVRYFELIDASENAALEASRAYLDVLRYRKLVSLAEENYVRHRAVFEQIQRKAQAGVARRVDLEQASGRLALAEANLLTETSNLHDVSARYQRLVGEVPGKELAPVLPMAKGLPGDASAVIRAVQYRNPALQAAIENVRAAGAAAETRKAAYQPRLDLRLRNERGGDLNGYLGSTDNRTAEVVMSWNLFNGFSDQARSRQYAEQWNVAKDIRDKTCRDVRQTAAIAYNDTRKLVEQLTYLDQHQLSTEKARDAYRKQFDIGQRTLLDLLDTENELFQARRAYVNADHDLLIAQVRTHASQGTLMQTLELARVARDEVSDPADWKVDEDGAEQCPPDAPVLFTVDKKALNERAAEFVRESIPAPEAVAPAAVVAQAAAAQPPSADREVAEALKAWAQAWTSRDVASYLNFYAPTFAPANARNRAAWAKERERVIGAAGSIKLDLSDITLKMKDKDNATTTFVQAYQSPTYRDVAKKTLEWQRVGGKWQITREFSEQAMQGISTRE